MSHLLPPQAKSRLSPQAKSRLPPQVKSPVQRQSPAASGPVAARALTSAGLALQRLQRRAGDSPQSRAAAALQMRADTALQRMGGLDDETFQARFAAPVQREVEPEQTADDDEIQKKAASPLQREAAAPSGSGDGSNSGGLPSGLRAGIESLSGHDVSDVQVHYNSSKPAAVGALAYTQGADIHVGPGQEQHLSHEAWHTVQQRQGRVQPTGSVAGLPLNDDPGLEREADVMGARAASAGVRQNRPEGDG